MTFIFALGVLILASIAFKKKALTVQGTVASIIIGFLILYGLSLYGLIILALFFITSNIIGNLLTSPETKTASLMEDKGGLRDASQVVANGGWAAASAALYGITLHPLWLLSFVAAMAAATSDTWASEIGKKSKRSPVGIFSLKTVPAGQSGGITVLGNAAGLAGSFFIAGSAFLLQGTVVEPEVYFSVITALLIGAAGFAGQWVDAAAGALFQALYQCTECEEITEKTRHCNKKTILIKGNSKITNDLVNHICTASAVGLVWFFGWIFYI